jgi:hypothetical protein
VKNFEKIDVEFEADAEQIEHFSPGENGFIDAPFWFWIGK